MLINQKLERQKYCRGQAIVEFAVVLPILLLLMLGLINLGVLINAQIILTQAAWEGARAGTTLNPSLGEGDAEITGAVQASIHPDEATRAAMSWPKPRGEPLTVRIAYPMNLALPLPITVTLGAEATSRIEYSN